MVSYGDDSPRGSGPPKTRFWTPQNTNLRLVFPAFPQVGIHLQKMHEFPRYFLSFWQKVQKIIDFGYEFTRFLRGDLQLAFFAHSTRKTSYFESPKRGQLRR